MPRYARRLPPSADNATAGRTQVEKLEMEEFANRLQHRRMEMEYPTQSDLAREVWGEIKTKAGKMAARNRDILSKAERGLAYPSPANLMKIVKVLGCTLEWLAPALVGAAVERQTPAVSITELAGRSDEVMLRVAKLVPKAIAAQIYMLLSPY